jgi:CheY-like chemotaxis protein
MTEGDKLKKMALIVDDSRLACKVLANMLDSLNVANEAVHSAEDALDYLKNSKPDLIFLDHTMPGMSGFQAVKIIKGNPETAKIPVLMYTTKQGDTYVSQAKALGAVDVLPKGMDKERLRHAIEPLGFGIAGDAATESGNDVVQLAQAPAPQLQASAPQMKTVPQVMPNIAVVAQDTATQSMVSQVAPVNASSEVGAQPKWDDFWVNTIQPALARTSEQQELLLKQQTQKQTLHLTKELHQTLEQFEHAFASRMDNNSLLERSRHIAERSRLSILMTLAFSIVFVVQIVTLFQLARERSDTQNIVQRQATMLADQKVLLDKLSNNGGAAVDTGSPAFSSPPSPPTVDSSVDLTSPQFIEDEDGVTEGSVEP